MCYGKAQERDARDARERLAEIYQASRDAYRAVMISMHGKRGTRIPVPWYLAADKARATGLTPETGLDEAIFRMARKTGRQAVQEGPNVVFRDTNRRVN